MKTLLATFFWIGYVPRAPGTAASLAATLVAGLYFLFFSSPLPLLWLTFGLLFAGLGLGRWAVARFGSSDPKPFVLDEVVGQLLACLPAAPGFEPPLGLPVNLAAAFVLFRVLDIAKPPPIRQAERLPGGWGIMADDVAAGLIAGAAVALLNLAYALRMS